MVSFCAADSHSWKYWIPDRARLALGLAVSENVLNAAAQLLEGDLRLLARSCHGFSSVSMHTQ